MGGYRTVVVGTDGSETSLRAVERAAELARDADATLVIACAYLLARPDPHAQDVLGSEAYQVVGSGPAHDRAHRACDRARTAGARRIETAVIQGEPGDVLRAVATDREADLLVVGNRGLNTVATRIIGSVPLDVVRNSPTDVLVVHTS